MWKVLGDLNQYRLWIRNIDLLYFSEIGRQGTDTTLSQEENV